MKVIDHAGNSIKVGRLLRWQPNPSSGPLDLYVTVKDVEPPTAGTPGRMVIELIFGIAPAGKSDSKVVQFKDFVTVMDPKDELKAEIVLTKVVGDGIQSVR